MSGFARTEGDHTVPTRRNKLLALLGPELSWIVVSAVALIETNRNRPPTQAGNAWLEMLGLILPPLGLVLSFLPFAWATWARWVLLLRVNVATLIGLFLVVGWICGAIDYHDSRNSGVGSAYVLYLALGLILLGAGNAIAGLFLLTKWRFVPVLRWAAAVIAVLSMIWAAICYLASLAPTAS